MGSCCQTPEVIETQSNKSTTANNSFRNCSFIFDKYSKQKDFRKKYDYISLIGSGSFGKVKLFVEKECRSFKYAIKTIKKDLFNPYHIQSIKREIEILRSLDHPNIVKYFETYEDEKYLHIVMEYIPGDNLFKVLTEKLDHRLTERQISQIMKCLLKAVSFLHHNNIIHRDIKPENIVFTESGSLKSLKLIDFGLSIQQNARRENRRVGTPYYMAPEMISGKFVKASDIWSIGVIMFILVTGKQPFWGKNKEEVLYKVENGLYDKKILNRSKCSNSVKDLIRRMLVLQPEKRITIETCLEHSWFKQFENNSDISLLFSEEIVESLRQFQYQNLLQKEIRYYLAKFCSDKEIDKLHKAFSAVDKDNSGEIEYEEIPKIFQELGINATDVNFYFIYNL